MIGLLLFFATVSITPAAPSVGDPVTITLESGDSRMLEATPDPCYEVISRNDRALVVRSFQPGPCRIEIAVGGAGEVQHTEAAEFTVVSVLEAGESEPSPMRPPRDVGVPRAAWWSIGIAATAALLAWLAVLLRPERARGTSAIPALAPLEELQHAAGMAGQRSGREQQVLLANAVRRYFDRTDPALRADRTTGETLRALSTRGDRLLEPVSLILRAGDRAKFSSDPVGDNPEALMAMQELLAHVRPVTDEGKEP